MAAPYHHALSSVKKWGGEPEDTLAIHRWFDESKGNFADPRHRALRHHAEGIFLMESIFGVTVTLSTCKVCGHARGAHGAKPLSGRAASVRLSHVATNDMSLDARPYVEAAGHEFEAKVIPTRWVGEQHVTEDLGFIPSAADWLRAIKVEPWMVFRARKLSRELEAAGRSTA